MLGRKDGERGRQRFTAQTGGLATCASCPTLPAGGARHIRGIQKPSAVAREKTFWNQLL